MYSSIASLVLQHMTFNSISCSYFTFSLGYFRFLYDQSRSNVSTEKRAISGNENKQKQKGSGAKFHASVPIRKVSFPNIKSHYNQYLTNAITFVVQIQWKFLSVHVFIIIQPENHTTIRIALKKTEFKCESRRNPITCTFDSFLKCKQLDKLIIFSMK